MLDASDIRDALLAKGMTQDSGDHEMFRKELEGVTTLVTKLSHRGRSHDVPDSLASAMAKQTCLQLAEFKDLVSCHLTEEGWDKKIRERCVGGQNPFMRR